MASVNAPDAGMDRFGIGGFIKWGLNVSMELIWTHVRAADKTCPAVKAVSINANNNSRDGSRLDEVPAIGMDVTHSLKRRLSETGDRRTSTSTHRKPSNPSAISD